MPESERRLAEVILPLFSTFFIWSKTFLPINTSIEQYSTKSIIRTPVEFFLHDQTVTKSEEVILLDNYLKSIDYDINDDTLDAEHYVSHPVSELLVARSLV